MGFNSIYDESTNYDDLYDGELIGLFGSEETDADDNDEEWAKSFPPLYEEFFD